ncbi:hypothetical protein AYO20_11320 [Fonsecaea nubica]|uniref:Uncharacterized protein n=1 Tax=Fonsecaea nubica TaxID=856822 RepID=A0A178BWF7_9EURO|nr:hypothetical protein AYO20_11320 [Fonsecaea nubica]OAL21677.1 hypothetical protein AYO20_11320 [Fonsecaea nubica]
MSIKASLSTASSEEVSGWWPSERSAKSRFMALLSRTKLEKFTRQNRLDSTSVRPNISQSVYSGPVASAPEIARAQASNANTTLSSPTPCTSQQDEKQVRRLRVQRNLTSIHPTYPRPLVTQQAYEELASPVLAQPAMYSKTSRNVSRSTADSLVHTLNSVESPTAPSLAADNNSIYTTHTSFSSYASSSCAPEPFVTIADSDKVPTTGDYSWPAMSTPTPYNAGVWSMYKPTPNETTKNVARPMTALDSLAGIPSDSRDLPVQKPLPPIPASPYRFGGDDRRISTIAPLPESGHIRKTSARYRCDRSETTTSNSSRCTTPTSPSSSSRPASIRSRSSTYTQDSAEGGRKRAASYSLFPRTPSTGLQKLPINGIPSPPIPAAATSVASSSSISTTTIQCTLPNLPSPSRPTTHAERAEVATRPPPPARDPRRHGQVLSLGKAMAANPNEKPQTSRICSVEEDGAWRVNPPSPQRLAKTPQQSVLPRQKSVPCLIRPRTPSSGPPPTEPLPALPSVASDRLSLHKRLHDER